ncbi:MAG: oligosaccharide flippase family protein [Methanotrichaceae archaeon]|nr:oligosaccharide flippase family protein [Methanotrichaceae archaeon]
MNKATNIAQVSAKGSFHVLWGLVISTIISAVGTIFVARLLGSDLYGLYAIALTAPNLMIIFRDWGIPSAMIRYAAQYRAEDRATEVRSILLSGLIFEIALGLALTLVSLTLSDYLAVSVFDRPTIAPLIQIASFSILAGSLISAATAAFTGTDRLEVNSIMLICESVIKTALMIGLVYMGLSTSGAVIGFTTAAVIAGLIGMILTWSIYKKLPRHAGFKLEIKAYITEMLRYGVPLSISAIVAGFLAQYYAFILPIYEPSDAIIGNYRIAQNFVVLIGFFATPITTVLFPAFSKLDFQKDKEALKNVFQFSIKYASLLVVPVATLVMSLSDPAVSTIFGTTYGTASLFLALLAISYLYAALGNLSAGNLLSSQGQTKLVLILALVTAAIGFPVGTILIPLFGVIGSIVGSLTVGFPSLFIALYWIRKHYNLTVDWSSSAKITLSSGVTGALTYLIVSQLNFASWLRLIIGVIIFVLILIPAMLFTRAITKPDLANLRVMIAALGPLRKIIGKVFDVVEKIMTVFRL